MSTADQLAQQIADLNRRLRAVEHGSQMPRTSIEGGALAVNDTAGTPVLTVGLQADGSYAVAGFNGGQVVATDLDLPGGTITETDIADDAISTPKLRANAVTTDKVAAGAITANEIAANAITATKISAGAIDGQTIKSPNYVAGSTGWIVKSDGSAEFANADIRGSVRVGTTYPYQIVGGPIPAELTTDPNGYPIVAIGMRWVASADREFLTCFSSDTVIPYVWEVGINRSSTTHTVTWYSQTSVAGGGLPDARVTRLIGGQALSTDLTAVTMNIDYGRLALGAVASGSDPARAPFLVDGVSAPRGVRGTASSTSSSASIGTTETAVLTITGMKLYPGRAYSVVIGGGLTSSAAGNLAQFRVRKTNTAGALLADYFLFRSEGSLIAHVSGQRFIRNSTAALITADIVLTLTANAGTVVHAATATQPRYLQLTDVGAAADYPHAGAVT